MKPAMVIDSSVIRAKYAQLTNLIDGVKLFYAVKSNPYRKVLELLYELGSGFEVGSLQELKLVKSLFSGGGGGCLPEESLPAIPLRFHNS